MEFVCPVCNGLAELTKQCPLCGAIMGNQGTVEDYYGPYSPYDDEDLYRPEALANKADVSPCVHLFACPECGHDMRVAVARVVTG